MLFSEILLFTMQIHLNGLLKEWCRTGALILILTTAKICIPEVRSFLLLMSG